MNLGEFAGAARGVADRARESLAIEACRAAAKEYLAVLETETPVRSGALRASEAIRSVTGDGSHAVALAGPDIVYDRFRNDGGTITKHTPGSLGTPAVGWFGHSVTQRGSHYMERARDAAQSVIGTVVEIVADEIIRL